jgi:hypothetical protein
VARDANCIESILAFVSDTQLNPQSKNALKRGAHDCV